MEILSSEYGWTPKEIREQRKEDIKLYFDIIRLKRIIENNKNKKYGRK
jgi:hypothetical protein